MIRVRLPRDPPPSGRAGGLPELDALADRIGRLHPSHRDPEAFPVEKDVIERELRRLARRDARPNA